MKLKVKRHTVYLYIILAVVIITIAYFMVCNHLNSSYDDLSDTDKQIILEVDKYYKSNKELNVWKDFKFEQKSVLAIDGSFGKSFLINPTSEINSIFVRKIDMPSGFDINVYRISPFAPQLLKFKFDGNFNTKSKTYNVFGNNVFYTKYDDSIAVSKKFTSKHYITFLSHESFHYYMQENWSDGSRFSTETLTSNDMELLRKEYEILDKIQRSLLLQDFERNILLEYSKEYINVINQRIAKNPEYMKQELSMETVEGTATYVGIKASKIVGYDYGVMYFDNIKNVPFSEVMSNIDEGNLEKSFLADRMPYETGALLCLLMDVLDVPDWQQKLNNQTLEKSVTLFSVIKEFVEMN